MTTINGPHKAIELSNGNVICEYCGPTPDWTGGCPSNQIPAPTLAQDFVSSKIEVTLLRATESVEVNTYDALVETIETKFSTLKKNYYTLPCNNQRLDQLLPIIDRLEYIHQHGRTVNVTKISIGFSDVKSSDIEMYTGIKFDSSDDFDVDVNISVFKETQSNIDSAVFDDLFKDLKKREKSINLKDSNISKSTMREFISPFLTSAIQSVNSLRGGKQPILMSNEKELNGRWCHGPLDYVIRINACIIMITEAKKKEAPSGIVKNLAQLYAAQESIATTVWTSGMGAKDRKRTFDQAFGNRVKSFGVVSTGTEYIFLMVDKDKIVKSETISISFSFKEKTTVEEACYKFQVQKILKMLVHVIETAAAAAVITI